MTVNEEREGEERRGVEERDEGTKGIRPKEEGEEEEEEVEEDEEVEEGEEEIKEDENTPFVSRVTAGADRAVCACIIAQYGATHLHKSVG